jgi:hypothetical protein
MDRQLAVEAAHIGGYFADTGMMSSPSVTAG